MLTNLAVKVVLDSTMIRKSSNAYKLNSKSCVGFHYDKRKSSNAYKLGSKSCVGFHYDQKVQQCLQTWQQKLY